MTDSDWLRAIDAVRGALETDSTGTALDQPGKVARLPDALGGDPKVWQSLGETASPTTSKAAFFKLLEQKAHYFLLPKPIVKAMGDSPKVRIDEKRGISKGYTSQNDDPPEAFMHVPTAGVDLAKSGYELGRTLTMMAGDNDILDTVYHEMTHAWLWLAQFYDAEIQKLAADGEKAYGSARGDGGKEFKPWTAFTEAAGYYVGDRVNRWCRALKSLDRLIRNPPRPGETNVETQVKTIVERYNEDVLVYGWVPVSDEREEKIATPALSAELRAVIDRRFLDGRPLTKKFADTPLAGLRRALLAR